MDDKDKDFISFKLINKSLSNSENLHYYAKSSILMTNYNYDSYHENSNIILKKKIINFIIFVIYLTNKSILDLIFYLYFINLY